MRTDSDDPRPAPWPMGPFDREPPEASPPRDRNDRIRFEHWNRARLLEALAGVQLGAWDQRVLDWLVGWEPSTVATIAGWVKRARRDAGAECPGCDKYSLDIRQETTGDLVCHRCGRMVAPTPPERPDDEFAELRPWTPSKLDEVWACGRGHVLRAGPATDSGQCPVCALLWRTGRLVDAGKVDGDVR